MGVPPGQTCLDVKVTNNQGHYDACHNHGKDVHKELSHGDILLSENSPDVYLDYFVSSDNLLILPSTTILSSESLPFSSNSKRVLPSTRRTKAGSSFNWRAIHSL